MTTTRISWLGLLCAAAIACGGVSSSNDGGATGTAGAGSSGSAGTGGGGGGGGSTITDAGVDSSSDAADPCAALKLEYAAALKAAKTCDLNAANQCIPTAPNGLTCPACPTHVQDPTKLADVTARWNATTCPNQVIACPAIACLPPANGGCVAKADAGVCADDFATAGP